jgi:hypothetical protein
MSSTRMFDEVRAINISHKNFDRKQNSYTFQTKDLGCDMSEYCLFIGAIAFALFALVIFASIGAVYTVYLRV